MHAREGNFFFLLMGLLALLLAGPLTFEIVGYTTGTLVSVAFSATLIIGIWSFVESRRWFITGVVLAAASLAITLLGIFLPENPLNSFYLDLLDLSIALIFCGLSLVFALRQVFTGTAMTLNRMTGAVCVYLLLGISLGIINLFIYKLVPGSFKGISDSADLTAGLDLFYYTFVTMTTLGYGDITPVRPLARAVAYMTAVGGQFYIAILVGMLVGLYLKKSD